VALPGEHALAQEYGISHGTMRKAIDQMVNQNLLIRHQGKGTFVATHDRSRALKHFFRMVGDDGKRELPNCRLIEREAGTATELEAEQLGMRVGARVLRFVRVRGTARRPFIVEHLVLPVSRFPNLHTNPIHDLPSLLYEYYSKEFGVIVVEAVEKLRVALANAKDAELLQVPEQYPLLQIDRVAMDVSQKPVEWRVSYCDTRNHYYLNRFG
jgi:GntR family transcriptional regulator